MRDRTSKRGASVKAKEKRADTAKNSNKNSNRNSKFRLGSSRAPTPANAGNVGLGGKTGAVSPKERAR
jgi:hypothetical protein